MTDFDDMPHPLLLDYLDGRLDAAQTRAVEVWIAEDASRSRLVTEHRATWDALGLADPARDVPRASPGFSQTLVERVQADVVVPVAASRMRVWRIAAALLIGAGLWAVLEPSEPTLQPMTASTAGGEFDLLEQYGDDLDIIADYQALQAIEGQLDGVLPR